MGLLLRVAPTPRRDWTIERNWHGWRQKSTCNIGRRQEIAGLTVQSDRYHFGCREAEPTASKKCGRSVEPWR